MAYPSSLDSFADPVAGDPFSLSSGESSTAKIAKIHAALAALEAKVGINSSAVTTSLDYLFNQGQKFIPFSHSGTLATGTGVWVIPVPENWTLTSVTWRISTPPTGAAFIMDINYDGSTACSTRPQTSATNSFITTAAVFSTTTLTGGSHYLSGDIDQVGSTVAGAGLFGLIGVRRR